MPPHKWALLPRVAASEDLSSKYWSTEALLQLLSSLGHVRANEGMPCHGKHCSVKALQLLGSDPERTCVEFAMCTPQDLKLELH